MNVYAYCAELLCQTCGEATVELLNTYVPEDERDDSDRYPQGPTPDGGGEADCPQHCGKCGQFLQNPLTNEGVLHVLESFSKYEENQELDETHQEWAEFYDLGPNDTEIWDLSSEGVGAC